MFKTLLIFRLFLFSGILIFFFGIYLKIFSIVSYGTHTNRIGGVVIKSDRYIDGNGVIFLALIFLNFSLIMFVVYKRELKWREKMIEKEKFEELYKN